MCDLPKEVILEIVDCLKGFPSILLGLSTVNKAFEDFLGDSFWRAYYQQHIIRELVIGNPDWLSKPTDSGLR